jgi:hypothetical protein
MTIFRMIPKLALLSSVRLKSLGKQPKIFLKNCAVSTQKRLGEGFTGMRDKLIHGYFGVDLDVVWDTVQQDLPILRPVIIQLLSDIS